MSDTVLVPSPVTPEQVPLAVVDPIAPTNIVRMTPIVDPAPAPVLALSADDAAEVQRLKTEGETIEMERTAAITEVDSKYKPVLDEMNMAKTAVNAQFADRVNTNSMARKAISDRVLGAERTRIDAMIKALKDQERALLGNVAPVKHATASGDSVPRGAQTQKIMEALTDTPQDITSISEKSGVGYGSASNILRNLADTERATLSGTRAAPAYAKRYVAQS